MRTGFSTVRHICSQCPLPRQAAARVWHNPQSAVQAVCGLSLLALNVLTCLCVCHMSPVSGVLVCSQWHNSSHNPLRIPTEEAVGHIHDLHLLLDTFTSLYVSVWLLVFVCLCVCVPHCECCCSTLIPVRALSQAWGRSGSKTQKTVEVLPSNQTRTDTERRERAGSVPARWYINTFLQSGDSRLGVRTGPLPISQSVSIKRKADRMQCEAANVTRETLKPASAEVC